MDVSRIHTDYDLDATLASGQTFAFSAAPRGYSGIAGGRPAEIERLGGGYDIICRDSDADFWRRYFDLDASYEQLIGGFLGSQGAEGGVQAAAARMPEGSAAGGFDEGKRFLAKCAVAFGGLRLLRQPAWETVCEFIISANNNIKRIGSIYKRISERHGEKTEWDGRVYSAFPAPAVLAALDELELKTLGLGYRAPYLLATAREISENGLPDLDAMEYGDALKLLMKYRGVGEKVADCVLLFSTRHRNAFPIDVWIERALRERFGMDGTRRELKRRAQETFGEAAGVAQQFIFYGMISKL